MKLGTKCTVSGSSIGAEEITNCDTCGRGVHERRREYETEFECRYCGDETWVGALEF